MGGGGGAGGGGGVGVWGGGGGGGEGVLSVRGGGGMGADITVGALKMRVVCVYGPQGRVEMEELVGSLAPHCATNRALVVGGDFNLELGGTGEGSVGAWRALFRGHGLVDGGGRTTPRLDGPTWRNSRGVQKRLDYIFLPRSLGPVSGRALPVFFSDHDGVLLTVRARVPVFGPGYWRLNLGVCSCQQRAINEDFGRDRRQRKDGDGRTETAGGRTAADDCGEWRVKGGRMRRCRAVYGALL